MPKNINPVDGLSKLPQFVVTFTASGIGIGAFQIEYKSDNHPYVPWSIPDTKRRTSTPVKLENLPYKATLDQVYWGFFSPELIMFRLEPDPEQVSKDVDEGSTRPPAPPP